MGRWDRERKNEVSKSADKLFSYSIVFSIGTLVGMALVYFFG